MPELPDRRQLHELQARYSLEPDIQDIYVEGQRDKVLVDAWLQKADRFGNVKVYEIDSVEVPSSLLRQLSLEVGNKGRVIALAYELSNNAKVDITSKVACLVDQDLDFFLDRIRKIAVLLYTSGLSLDCILSHPTVLDRFLSQVLLAKSLSAEGLFEKMMPVLTQLLLIRIAAAKMSLSVELPDVASCCQLSETHRFGFDSDSYVRRVLNKAGRGASFGEFISEVERRRQQLKDVLPRPFHVDDLIGLLHIFSRRMKRELAIEIPKLRAYLFGMIDPYVLAELPEIAALSSRFGIAKLLSPW